LSLQKFFINKLCAIITANYETLNLSQSTYTETIIMKTTTSLPLSDIQPNRTALMWQSRPDSTSQRMAAKSLTTRLAESGGDVLKA